MPEDWGHTQTHTTYSKAQVESENICYTFLFGLCPLIKTIAPPSFGNFHCQITWTACLSCAAVREFLGKEYSIENLFTGGPFAFDPLLSVTRVAQSYIKKKCKILSLYFFVKGQMVYDTIHTFTVSFNAI